MLEKNILLSKIEDVKEFVRIVTNYKYDIDLISGKYIVDAKSIMGIFSLDLSKPIHLQVHCDQDDQFISDIEKFICD